MTDLRESLDDLLEEVPSYVVPDARRAWAAGARRRLRRRLGAAAAVVVLVALTAGLVGMLPRASDVPPADGESRGVDGHPARIEKPWFLRDLPDAPGAVAGLLQTGGADVLAVGPTGSVWRLPQDDAVGGYPVAVSGDGRRIAYLADGDTFVLRDLVAGETTIAPDVGDGTFRDDLEDYDTDHPYYVAMQAPAFFSPDGGTVLVLGGPTEPGPSGNGALLVGADGSTSFLEAPGSGRDRVSWPAGWTPSGDVVWFGADFPRNRPRWARAVVTDTDGRQLRTVELAVPKGLRGVSQWTGSVSPDGESIALTTEASGRVFVMSLRTGEQVDGVVASNYGTLCPLSWAGDDPRPPLAGAEGTLLVDGRDRPQVQTDPALHALCAIWATDALTGERHRGLPERLLGDGWLSWHWQEVLIGTVVCTLVLALALVLIRRRIWRAR